MLQSVSMFPGKSFITSEQSGVCSQLQEDPLSPPGYNLPVSCVSSYRHSKVFPRLSEIIFLQGFRNLLLLSVTSFWPSVFRWDKTNRSLPFLLTTSSLILCTIYCTHSKLWSKKPISSISHSEPHDKVHVFNTAFGGPRSWWVISHTSNKFVFKNTGSKVSDAPSDLTDSVGRTRRRNTLPSRGLPNFVYVLYVVSAAWQPKWIRKCLGHQSHHTTDIRQVQRHLSSLKF